MTSVMQQIKAMYIFAILSTSSMLLWCYIHCGDATECLISVHCFGLLQVRVTSTSWSWYSAWLVQCLTTTSTWPHQIPSDVFSKV